MRILFLLQPGTNSRSIFEGLIRGFAAAGHTSLVLELEPFWRAMNAQPHRRQELAVEASRALAEVVRRERPDASAAMWANGIGTFAGGPVGGAPGTIFDLLGLPHLAFWLDAPHWACGGSIAPLFGSPALRGPMLAHAINNPGTADEMTALLGFGHTLAVPYAVDPNVFRPYEHAREFDLVASCGPGDPPPTREELHELSADVPDMAGLRRARAQTLAPALETIGREFEGGVELLRALLESQLADRHTPMLARARRLGAAGHGPALTALLADPTRWVRATALVRSIEAFERAFTIAWLSRRCRMAVFGAAPSAWPFQATMPGDIAFEDMPRWYCRGLAGLNVMRWQDDVGLNIKPIEIGASGVPCLCARREGLGAILQPLREVLVFDTPEEALQRVAALRDDPARAAQIGSAARNRIERDHTWARRSAEFTRALPLAPRKASSPAA
jgi:hypothetical protein